MKERPILFSAPMVRALLDGSKTQTRRIVKPQPTPEYSVSEFCDWESDFDGSGVKSVKFSPPFQTRGEWRWWPEGEKKITCSYGQPGDQLWVKETHWWDNKSYVEQYKDQPWLGMPDAGTAELYFRATEKNPDIFPRWRPSIFMPRWASRIQLEITGVRVERLQEISEADAEAEGVVGCARQNSYPRGCEGLPQRAEYAIIWESINGDGSWAKNPWVWVIEFRRVAP